MLGRVAHQCPGITTPAPLSPKREAIVRQQQPGEWLPGAWLIREVEGTADEPGCWQVTHQGQVLATLPDWAGNLALWIAETHEDVPELLATLDAERAENTRLRAERHETNGKVVDLTVALRAAEKRHADLSEAMDALATAWSRPGMSGPSRVAGQHLAQVLAQFAPEATEAEVR